MSESAEMTLRVLATVLFGFVLAAPANAQLDNAPPNAVEDQSSFSARQVTEPAADSSVSYAFEQLTVTSDSRQAIPLAPRSNKATEPDLVAQPTSRK